eukprot:9424397-Pyramimonas_sp.AAC.1
MAAGDSGGGREGDARDDLERSSGYSIHWHAGCWHLARHPWRPAQYSLMVETPVFEPLWSRGSRLLGAFMS